MTSHYHSYKISGSQEQGAKARTMGMATRTAKKQEEKQQLCTCITLFCTFLRHPCVTVT